LQIGTNTQQQQQQQQEQQQRPFVRVYLGEPVPEK